MNVRLHNATEKPTMEREREEREVLTREAKFHDHQPYWGSNMFNVIT